MLKSTPYPNSQNGFTKLKMEKKSKIFSRITDALKNLLLFVKEINILSQNTMSNLKKLTLEMDIWLILNIESNIKSLILKNKDK